MPSLCLNINVCISMREREKGERRGEVGKNGGRMRKGRRELD